MFSGFYTAASGVLMNQRALNISANNIANVKTSGYQSKRLVKTTFDEQLVRQMNGQTTGIGGGSTISVAEREMTTHRQVRTLTWRLAATVSSLFRAKTGSI